MCIISMHPELYVINTSGHGELPQGVDIDILFYFLPKVPQQRHFFCISLNHFLV